MYHASQPAAVKSNLDLIFSPRRCCQEDSKLIAGLIRQRYQLREPMLAQWKPDRLYLDPGGRDVNRKSQIERNDFRHITLSKDNEEPPNDDHRLSRQHNGRFSRVGGRSGPLRRAITNVAQCRQCQPYVVRSLATQDNTRCIGWASEAQKGNCRRLHTKGCNNGWTSRKGAQAVNGGDYNSCVSFRIKTLVGMV